MTHMMYAPMNSRYRPANKTNPPPAPPQAGAKQTDAQINRGGMGQGSVPQGRTGQPLTPVPHQTPPRPKGQSLEDPVQDGRPQTNQAQGGQADIPQNGPQTIPRNQGNPVQYNQQANPVRNTQPQGNYSQGMPFQNQQNQPRQNQWNQNQGPAPNGQWTQAQNQVRMNQMQGNRPMGGMGSGQSPISGLLGKLVNLKDPIGSLNKIVSIIKLLG